MLDEKSEVDPKTIATKPLSRDVVERYEEELQRLKKIELQLLEYAVDLSDESRVKAVLYRAFPDVEPNIVDDFCKKLIAEAGVTTKVISPTFALIIRAVYVSSQAFLKFKFETLLTALSNLSNNPKRFKEDVVILLRK